MIKKIVRTKNAPLPIGSYNQGIISNGFVFTAGQIAIDPSTGKLIAGSFQDRVEQVFNNLENILKAAGSDLSKVVPTPVSQSESIDWEPFIFQFAINISFMLLFE